MKDRQRLVDIRKQKRDNAAQKYAEKQKELQRLSAAKERLNEAIREELKQSTEEEGQLDLRRLELLDLARQSAYRAEKESQKDAEVAKDEMLLSQKELRQMEWLKEKERAEKEKEKRKKEQKEADAIANRLKRTLGLLILILSFMVVSCSDDDNSSKFDARIIDIAPASQPTTNPTTNPASNPASAPSNDAAIENGDLKADSEIENQWTDPDEKKSADRELFEKKVRAELKLLGKLKERAKKLDKLESEHALRHKEIKSIESRVQNLLQQLTTLQNKVEKGVLNTPKMNQEHSDGSKKKNLKNDSTSLKLAKSATSQPSDAKKLSRLAEMITKMKPRAAGTMLSTIKPNEAARVLLMLPKDKAASLLGRLSDDSIGKVGNAIAKIESERAKARAKQTLEKLQQQSLKQKEDTGPKRRKTRKKRKKMKPKANAEKSANTKAPKNRNKRAGSSK